MSGKMAGNMKVGTIMTRNMEKGNITGLTVRFSRGSGYMERERAKEDI